MRTVTLTSRWLIGMSWLAAVGAWGPAHAFQEFEECAAAGLEGAPGMVQSVREVLVARDIHAFDPDLHAHAVGPETEEEIAVRLDAGPLVIVIRRESHGLSAGQRVRVQLDGAVAQVRRDWTECRILLAGSGAASRPATQV